MRNANFFKNFTNIIFENTEKNLIETVKSSFNNL
jgi:hypothetical protein